MIEAALKRDRSIVAGALALVTALAWAWTLTGAGMGDGAMDHGHATPHEMALPAPGAAGGSMDHGAAMEHGAAPSAGAAMSAGAAIGSDETTGAVAAGHAANPVMEGDGAVAGALDAIGAVAPWNPSHAFMMYAMWVIMMTAMMLPSAAPFVLLAVAVQHRSLAAAAAPIARASASSTVLSSAAPAAGLAGLMVLGYLGVWAGFSALATLAQWVLHGAGALSSGSLAVGPAMAGVILIAAGAYQFTPAKRACLRHCRSPVGFLSAHWRAGGMRGTGAILLGALHGVFCVGCCWLLMALLFAGGLMNPLWIAGIALYVLIEKVGPGGERLGRATGVVLVAMGIVLLSRNF